MFSHPFQTLIETKIKNEFDENSENQSELPLTGNRTTRLNSPFVFFNRGQIKALRYLCHGHTSIDILLVGVDQYRCFS